MIDWLSLIEQHNDFMLARELTEESRREYKERERMARVIREYAPIVQCAEIYSCATEEVTFEECSEALILMTKLIDTLSPDAKEIIDDCTAPSST